MKSTLPFALFLFACGSQTPVGVAPAPTSPAPGATPHHQPAGVIPITDENGAVFQISQGEPGAPETIGCADGQREAFVDAATFPTIAGCIGEWSGPSSMRTRPAGEPCGDDLGPCGAPADACAVGWHVCGYGGQIAEVAAIGAEACAAAGGGRFVAAISHCASQVSGECAYEAADSGLYACYESGWCSEPVCCGADCGDFGECRDGVWPGQTHIPRGMDQGCGAIASSRARGVLCCRG